MGVPGTDIRLPITVLNGAERGKTVLITAGIHGCEYPGIWTAVSLAKELEASMIAGQVVILPLVNPQAFWQHRAAIVPEDGKNINRMFPGKADGTVAEKTAHFLTHVFQRQVDFYLDLHGGDQQEELYPYVYYPSNAAQQITAISKAAALAVGGAYIVGSTATTGAYNSAALRGTPPLLLERGCLGLCPQMQVETYKCDVYKVLRHLGVLPNVLDVPSCIAPQEVTDVIYLAAENAGCWRPEICAGQRVQTGKMLGRVFDLFGNLLQTYTAVQDGVVLYRGAALEVTPGQALVTYGRVTSRK